MNLLTLLLFLLGYFLPCQVHSKNYTLFALGDSSVQFTFYPDLESFGPHWMLNTINRTVQLSDNDRQSLTCFMQALSGKTIHGINKIMIESIIPAELIHSFDAIIISFGVVDIIWHIKEQAMKQNKSIEEIIEELTVPYINNILHIKQAFPDYTNPIIIMATIPPLNTHTIAVNRALNASLKYYADQNNIPFFDPYDSCINEEGVLLKKYSQLDGVHFALNTNQVLIDALYYFLENLTVHQNSLE